MMMVDVVGYTAGILLTFQFLPPFMLDLNH
jgi:uncharacterized protein with PQ loop repeat